MSVAQRRPVSPPELELVPSDDASVHYLEHGYPSELVRWHCHSDYELHYIVNSVGKVFVGDHVGHFGPGQLVLTGPRLPHNWISEVATGETIKERDRVIQFGESLIPGMARLAPELAGLLPLLDRARHGIEFGDAVSVRHADRFQALRDADRPVRIAQLIDFLTELANESDYTLLSTLPMSSRADEAALDKVERVTRYVAERYAETIPLATVADLVGMSESAFSRFFARATGNGFTRFLNRVRVARACELLASTDEAITTICFTVGFNNVANFNRRFRELKDVTPREYRRATRLLHRPHLGRPPADARPPAGDQGRR